MRPLSQELLSEATQLSVELTESLGKSPLSSVAERLVALLDGVGCAVQHGAAPSNLRRAIGSVRLIRKRLPDTWGPRFEFDADLLQQILMEWQTAGARVSGAITPRYANGWEFSRVPMPSEDTERTHVIRVVTFPGEDRLSDIDLPDYAWLFHELGHDALYDQRSLFRSGFDEVLSARLRALTLRGAADTGRAARYAAEYRERLEGYWRPRSNQRDWAHEIATDVVALWAVGPAFLLRFTRLLVHDADRALTSGEQHPTYVTRAEALVLAAEHLGWPEEAWALQEEVRIVRAREDLDRSALVYADSELIEGAVDQGLDACASLCIPRMTPARLDQVREDSVRNPYGLSGTALVACAPLRQRVLAPDEYELWEREVIGLKG